MIRNFRDFLGSVFGSENKDEKEPDLFDYAQKEPGSASRIPASDSEAGKKRTRLIVTASLISLYPLFFAAGYLAHKTLSSCDELQSAISMNPENSTGEGTDAITVSPEEARYLGMYQAEVSGHKARLYIYAMKTGGIGGSIRFTEWGKREIEYLKGVRVANNTLTFIRSCQGLECARIGSPSIIYQVYSGSLNAEGTAIDGRYSGGQSSSNWNAVRIQ